MRTVLIACFATICFIQPARSQSPEAIHVHFDKDMYLPGETIWFKAYLYNGYQASGLSTNFYAAIYDEEGKLLQQKQYPIFEGTASGDFTLPDTIKASRLQFTAFTKEMQAINISNSYKRIITIFNKKNKGAVDLLDADRSLNLQFFPEGGKLVEGISNYIAYKAFDKNGSPAQVKGNIIELGTNNEIDSFFTNSMGMGKLQFIPQAGKSYFAIWKDPDGQIVNTALPVVNRSGAGLHIDQAGNTLYYVIAKNTEDANLNSLKLSARLGNEEVYQSSIVLNNSMKIVNQVPLDSFSNGLVRFTLSDANNNPLQTRVVLINKKDKAATVSHIEKGVGPKAKNVIEFKIPDTIQYNLSASISDINFHDKKTNNGIQQELWFNADAQAVLAKIPQDILESSPADIDLLILTNGSQHYLPANVQQAKPDNYLTVTINYVEKGYALPKKEAATLVINDKTGGNQFYVLEQSSQTGFIQSGLIFYDSTRLHYKTNHTKDLEKHLVLQKSETAFFPKQVDKLKITTADNSASITAGNNGDSLLLEPFLAPKPAKFNEERTIKGVTIKSKYVNPETKRLLELDEKYATGMFRGLARGYQINVVDDEDAWTSYDIPSYVAYKFPFLILKSGAGGSNGLYTISRQTNKPVKVLVFLDETEMQDQAGLSSISMSQVAYIKFINGIVIGSSFVTSDGALYIYSRKGDERVLSGTPNMQSKMVKGYDSPKEFFNPDYTDKTQLSIPDLRSTIYWNPYLIADKANNNIKIEYYNNDISKKLLLVIEGFTEDGKLIHIEKLIEN